MKELGWKLAYLPAHIVIAVGFTVTVIMWLPVIVWLLMNDALLQEGDVIN